VEEEVKLFNDLQANPGWWEPDRCSNRQMDLWGQREKQLFSSEDVKPALMVRSVIALSKGTDFLFKNKVVQQVKHLSF